MPKIGVQMSTIKDSLESLGIDGLFKKLSETGFSSVEVSQIPTTPENVEAMKIAQEKYGVSIDAWSAGLEPMMPGQESLTTEFDKIVADMKKVDCKFVRIGMLPFHCMSSLDAVIDFAKKANDMAIKLEEHGIKLYYHTHHVEFIKYDGKLMMDIIREHAPKLGLELDVHWMQRGGVNPIEYIKTCAGVVDIIHLKDYKILEPKNVMENLSKGDYTGFMTEFTNNIRFAPVGEGNLDMKGIIDAAISVGAQIFFIEQDDMYGGDGFESLATSKKNLEALGYGEWF